MLKERGIVEGLSADKAIVRIERSSACSTCESRGSCQALNEREFRIEVKNDLNALAGDVVEISMASGSVFRASMAVYFLPVMGLLLGALAGGALAGAWQVHPTASPLIGGGAGLALSIWILKRFDRSVRSRPDYLPKMTGVLRNSGPSLRCDGNR